MKKSLFIIFQAVTFVCLSVTLHAQEWKKNLPQKKASEYTLNDYQNAFNNYWQPRNVVRGKMLTNTGELKKAPGWKQFKRWEWYMISQIDEDGRFPEKTAAQVLKEHNANFPGLKSTGGLGNWISIGPNSSAGGYAGVGRINVVAFHPTDDNTYWAGAASGGLWVTFDNGITWSVLTDDNNVLGISDIAIPGDYSTSGTIYIATGDRDGWDNRSTGVLKSTDGGASWNATNLSFAVSSGQMTTRLLINPNDDQTILAATTNGVYKTTNGGVNWDTRLTTTSFIDFEYKPGDYSVLYGSTKNGEIYVSTDAGSSWTQSLSTSGKRVELAVTPADSSYVYAIVSASDNGLLGIYKSTNFGATFSQVFDGTQENNNLLGWDDGSDSGGQGWYDLAIDVSPNDENTLLIGGINTWRSTDGGTTWSMVNHWYGGYFKPSVHADKHDLKFRSNGDLFECNDGGIYLSIDNGTSWTDKTNGITISQMYKIGTAQTVNDEVICGLQDNGTKLVDGNYWTDKLGGDGMECIIDYSNHEIQYGSLYYGEISRTLNHWNSATNITPADAEGAWVTPYIINPLNPSILYVGYDELYKSTDRGNSWDTISSFSGGNLINIAIAPSDTNMLIVSTSTSIWKTVDGGTNWTNLSSLVPSDRNISCITIKHDDPNTIWLTYSGYNLNRVFESTNGGLNWTNISSGLPALPVHSIVQNTLVTGAELYAGTDVGVYYKSPVDDWVPFNNNLPNVIVRELEIYYDTVIHTNSRLRAATYGRGLWESDLILNGDYPPIVKFDETTDLNETSCTLTGTITEDFGSMVSASGFLLSTSNGIIWAGEGVTTVSTNPVDSEGAFSVEISGLSPATTYYVRAFATNANGTGLSVENSFTTSCGSGISSFPYSQDFSHGIIPPCWTMDDLQGNGQVWTFNNPGERTINTSTANNGFAIIDSDDYGSGNSQNCDLISPVFNFSSHTNITVEFEHYYRHYGAQRGTFSYSTDNGSAWTELQSWATTTNNAEVFSQDLTNELKGKPQVKFKWNFTGTWGYYWAFDDFTVSAEPDSSIQTNILVSGTTLSTGETDCFNATQTITVAGDGTQVIVESGASANFIAGQNIRFLPGFHAQEGSYLRGYITTTGNYCVEAPPALVAAETTNKEAIIVDASLTEFADREMVVYPNPNSGEFTIELRNFEGDTRVMLFNAVGQLVWNELTIEPKIRMSIPNAESGMYFITAINNNRQFSRKIVVR